MTREELLKPNETVSKWPPCPACGCAVVAVVDQTAETAYLVCSDCEHTWRVASPRPKRSMKG